jgi:hypothetical protein
MNPILITGVATLLCVPAIAMAQTTPTTPPKAPEAPLAGAMPAENAMKSPGAAAQKAMPVAGDIFTIIEAKADLSSKVIGLEIYNNEKQDIGEIKDIAFGSDGVQAYIVGVGGFLGMGDRYVAVRPSAIAVTYDVAGKTWHALMDTDAAKLKAAPEYKYGG